MKNNSFHASKWSWATLFIATAFFGLSVRWSYIDNSPPAWDQGLYLYQAYTLYLSALQNGIIEFVTSIFNIDRGRVPFMLMLVQPAFYFFGPSLDAGVISLNLTWFILAWSIPGIVRELSAPDCDNKAGLFAFFLFGLYPLSIMLSHNFLVEFLLTGFVCASIYSLLLVHRTGRVRWALITGIFIGLGLLTKVTFSVFVIPALIIIFYNDYQHKSARSLFCQYGSIIFILILIAGPYYLLNFHQIISLIKWLSSNDLSRLYGFGDAFDIQVILTYWSTLFANPAILIVFIVMLILILLLSISHNKIGATNIFDLDGKALSILGAWFVIPFVIATLGAIKDSRYVYPGLIPIFIMFGLVAARISKSRSGFALVITIFGIALPGYLHSNGYIKIQNFNVFFSKLGLDTNLATDNPPDRRDWQTDKLVQQMGQILKANEIEKKVVFLGGSRYYHLKLLDYEGLKSKLHLNYVVLPYYSSPDMSVDESLEFIKQVTPSGIVFKSGENWPLFSTKLDLKIIERLKRQSEYTLLDLNIEQPDGSKFYIFVKKDQSYHSIASVSTVEGKWKVGDALATILVDSMGVLTVVTESGVKGSALIIEGDIYVPKWNISGRLTEDMKTIHWSNGSVWIR